MSEDASTDPEAAYRAFLPSFRSLVLATVSEEGEPLASNAPFIMDSDRTLYVMLSDLAAHARHLQSNRKANVLFIEAERDDNLFARQRLNYDCEVRVLDRKDPAWEALADRFADRFGNIIGVLRGLADFRIFALRPRGGLFVIGFGQAYRVGADLETLVHVRRG